MEDDEAQWEQVHSPFSHTNPPWNIQALHIDDHFPQNLETESAIVPLQEPDSPPSLPSSSSSSSPTPPPESPPRPPSPSASSSTNLKAGGDEQARRPLSCRGSSAAREIAARLRLQLRILSAEARRVAARALAAGRLWSAAWAVAGAVAAFLLSLLYRRWRRRALAPRDHDKERLVLLLREKDERIGQLMIRIAEMNEALSARRRVPVIRVG